MVGDRYGVTGVPETYFVDRHGRLVGFHISGPITDVEVRRAVRAGRAGGAQLVILRAAAALVAALAVAAPAAAACTPRTSLPYLEGQIMCPTCHTTLDQSDAPAAQRIEALISKRIAPVLDRRARSRRSSCRTSAPAILAAPPRKGFDLLAWWLPIVGVLAGAALLAARRLALEPRPRRRRGAAAGRRRRARRGEREARSTTRSRTSSNGRAARDRVRGGLRLRRHAVRAAARPRLSLGDLERRGGTARRARRGAARRRREHSVHRRLHRRLRRSSAPGAAAIGGVVLRERADGDRRLRADRASASRSSACCRCRSALFAPGLLDGRAAARLGGAARRCVRRLRRAVHRHRARRDARARERHRHRAEGRRAPRSRTRSGSAPRSSSPGSRSRARWARSAGCATATG